MTHTFSYGTKSTANKAIGGVPIIHYFDSRSRGCGQVVRLLLIVRSSISSLQSQEIQLNIQRNRMQEQHIKMFATPSKNGQNINERLRSRNESHWQYPRH